MTCNLMFFRYLILMAICIIAVGYFDNPMHY